MRWQRKKIDWAAYDESLKQRGNLTFWISDETIKAWNAKPSGKPGGQSKFSDLAIETALILRLVFKQGLRQTKGLIESVFNMMKLDLDVPDYSTLSRRGKVIFIDPYPKSELLELFSEMVDSNFHKKEEGDDSSRSKEKLLQIEPYEGISPEKYHLFFNSKDLKRKSSGGEVIVWNPDSPRFPLQKNEYYLTLEKRLVSKLPTITY